MAFDTLFSPIAVGARELRNRIVHAATVTGLGRDRAVTDRLIAYHAARAQRRHRDDRDRADERSPDQQRRADPGEHPRRGQPGRAHALGRGGGAPRLPADRPARPHRPPAALGPRFRAAQRVLPARGALLEQRPAARRGRDSGHRRGLCGERGAAEARGLQRGRAARRPRLPDRAVPLARLQRPDGRLRRQPRRPHPLHARGDGGGPRRLRPGLHRRYQAAGGRAGAGRHRPRRGRAHRPRGRGRGRARLPLLQPGRVRSCVRYPSARHALPAPAVPAAPCAAPRGRRRAPGDRPRPDRIGATRQRRRWPRAPATWSASAGC